MTTRGVYADYLQENELNVDPKLLSLLRKHKGNVWLHHGPTGVTGGPHITMAQIRRANYDEPEENPFDHEYGVLEEKPDMMTGDVWGHQPHGQPHSGPGGHFFVTTDRGFEDAGFHDVHPQTWQFHPETKGATNISPLRGFATPEEAHQHAATAAATPSAPPSPPPEPEPSTPPAPPVPPVKQPPKPITLNDLLAPRRRARAVRRYAAGQSDLAGLLRAARSDPYDATRHGVIADALDEAHPGNQIAELIREQYGMGQHADKGAKNNLWYEPFENSWDGTFPYAARLGTHGPFDLYLRHEGGTAPFAGTRVHMAGESPNARWVLHAVSRLRGSRDSGYTFEFPHEEVHRIPQMFPAATAHINPVDRVATGHWPAIARDERNEEAQNFDDRMDEEERNRQ